MNYDTIKFKDSNFEMDVNVSPEDDNIWLTIKEMCTLFEREKSTISRYVKSIVNENDQTSGQLVAKHATYSVANPDITPKNPNIITRRPSKLYSLEVTLKIGEKLRSDRGIKLKQLLDRYLDEKYNNNNQIIIYNDGTISLPVTISPEEDTVYLTQSAIAELFHTTKQNVSLHIKNIVEDGELTLSSTVKESFTVQFEGGRSIRRSVDYYNLDMILSIGYRVKSKIAIGFRKWATQRLKDYLINGFAVDTNRIKISHEALLKYATEFDQMKKDIDKIKSVIFVELEDEIPIERKHFFDAYLVFSTLMKQAKKSIIIIDPYFDLTGLRYLNKVDDQIKKIVIYSNKSSLTEDDVEAFQKQHGPIIIAKSNHYHDRIIIIDNSICYSSGSSINNAGDKYSIMNKVYSEDIIKSLLKQIEEIINIS